MLRDSLIEQYSISHISRCSFILYQNRDSLRDPSPSLQPHLNLLTQCIAGLLFAAVLVFHSHVYKQGKSVVLSILILRSP